MTYMAVPVSATLSATCESLVQETDMFTKTVSSGDAASAPAGIHSRRVFLVIMSVSSCTVSDRPFGICT